MDALTESNESMALLALSHTPVEHKLYEAMLVETAAARTRVGTFSVRRLMTLTGLNSYSTIRRARTVLLSKLSIDCQKVAGEGSLQQPSSVYLVYRPEEIFARRRQAGLEPYPQEYRGPANRTGFSVAIERVVKSHSLSRREAQVALCCAEGLSNLEIGAKLFISEQTVKFHLRHVFVKFGVKRRGELISRLLCHGGAAEGEAPAGK